MLALAVLAVRSHSGPSLVLLWVSPVSEYARRDKYVVKIANLILRLASPRYRAMVGGSIQYGMRAAARDVGKPRSCVCWASDLPLTADADHWPGCPMAREASR